MPGFAKNPYHAVEPRSKFAPATFCVTSRGATRPPPPYPVAPPHAPSAPRPGAARPEEVGIRPRHPAARHRRRPEEPALQVPPRLDPLREGPPQGGWRRLASSGVCPFDRLSEKNENRTIFGNNYPSDKWKFKTFFRFIALFVRLFSLWVIACLIASHYDLTQTRFMSC